MVCGNVAAGTTRAGCWLMSRLRSPTGPSLSPTSGPRRSTHRSAFCWIDERLPWGCVGESIVSLLSPSRQPPPAASPHTAPGGHERHIAAAAGDHQARRSSPTAESTRPDDRGGKIERGLSMFVGIVGARRRTGQQDAQVSMRRCHRRRFALADRLRLEEQPFHHR